MIAAPWSRPRVPHQQTTMQHLNLSCPATFGRSKEIGPSRELWSVVRGWRWRGWGLVKKGIIVEVSLLIPRKGLLQAIHWTKLWHRHNYTRCWDMLFPELQCFLHQLHETDECPSKLLHLLKRDGTCAFRSIYSTLMCPRKGGL